MGRENKDRNMTGTDTEGTTYSVKRRGFLKVTAGLLYAVIGTLLALPFLKTLITPPKTRRSGFSEVGNMDGFPVGRPVDIQFHTRVQDAFYHEEVLHLIWVVRNEDGSVTVYSPVCPHLGCYYKWNEGAGQFQCPCHASTFARDGTVLGGPAPRPLDTLPHRIENGILYVRWVDYAPGIPERAVV